MKVWCVGCSNKEFEINPAEVPLVSVITLICPWCGEHTGIMERKGGGLVIGVDKFNKGEIPDPSVTA